MIRRIQYQPFYTGALSLGAKDCYLVLAQIRHVSVFGHEIDGVGGGNRYHMEDLHPFDGRVEQKGPLKRPGIDLGLVKPISGARPHLALARCLVV